MYNVFYKAKNGMMVVPCRTESQGKKIAKDLHKSGKIGVKLCKIEETVLYIPSLDH